jgi:F-type H+-transporting ATPase subunit a
MNFVVGLLEGMGEVAKIISFAFRLFGNLFAGMVLLAVISSLVPFLAPIVFYFLELFVGAVQALVFTMLTAAFIVVATAGHEEH